MQGILIALATAITVAIAGAFAAPFVVDWNDWRSTFEREMGAALGMPVTIRGPIEAEILPAPRMVLRDVSLGDAASSGGTIQELDTELSLGGLLRGNIEATGLTLVRPELRLVLDNNGRIRLPAGTGIAGDIRISQISVQDGILNIQEQSSARHLTLEALNLRGEARSLSGPFRLDGTLRAGAADFTLRTTLGELDNAATGRLRLNLEGRGQPYVITLDGTLKMALASPAFAGRATLARQSNRMLASQAPANRGNEAGGTDWQLSADVIATPASIEASRLDLGFGTLSSMAQLSGTGHMILGPRLSVEAQLSARAFDMDALGTPGGEMPGSSTTTPPVSAPAIRAAALARHLVPLLSSLPAPDAPSRIALAAEQLALGGAVLNDVKADFTGSEAGWHIGRLEARMPGETTLTASARPNTTDPATSSEGLQSDITLEAQDPAAFLRWATPDMPRVYSDMLTGPAHLATTLTTLPGHMALRALSATFGQARLSGDISFDLTRNTAPRLEATLNLEGFALDGLVPAAQNAALSAGAMDAAVSLTGKNLSFAGTSVTGLNLDATAKGGGLAITRLIVNTPGGIHMEGSGTLDQATAPPRGSLRLAITGPSAEGLVPVAGILAGEEAAAILARIKAETAPVDLDSTLVWHGLEGYEARFSGTLGQTSGDVSFARDPGQTQADILLSARTMQASTLLAALGMQGLAPAPGPAQVELKMTHGTQGETAISGRLSLEGLDLRGEGSARRENDRLQPRLAMHLKGDDLARLLPQIRTTTTVPLPADINFTLTALEPAWRLESLSGTLGIQKLSGEMEIIPGEIMQLSGKLAFETLSLPHILALFAVQTEGQDLPAAPARWSAAGFSPPRPHAVSMDMKLSAPTIALLPPYAVTDGQTRLLVQQDMMEVRDLLGTFGGGHLSAGLRVQQRGETVQATGRLMLDTVDIAALTAPAAASSAPEGKVSLSLDLVGSGNSPLALVENLSGQGTITAQNLILPAAATPALASVLRQTEKLDAPPDERATAHFLDVELARGSLTIPAIGSALGVSGGVIRLAPAHATIDSTRISLGGLLDMARLQLDARLDLEQPAGAWGVAGGGISWTGALDAPVRKVSALPLASALSMRAIERETKRLEEERGKEERAREERAQNQRAQELQQQQERIIRERQQAQPVAPLPPRAPSSPAPSPAMRPMTPLPAPRGIERTDLPAPSSQSPRASNSPPAADMQRPQGSIGLH